jgi:hypothetical protein
MRGGNIITQLLDNIITLCHKDLISSLTISMLTRDRKEMLKIFSIVEKKQ